jgi:hypothetical protein
MIRGNIRGEYYRDYIVSPLNLDIKYIFSKEQGDGVM